MKTSKTGELLPETFEEWVTIHGDPEYKDINQRTSKSTLKIEMKHCQQTDYKDSPNHIGLYQCIYETEKGIKRINYSNMTTAIAQATNCIYHRGMFYTPDGSITSEYLRQEITASLEAAGWTDKLDAPVTSILNTVRDKTYKEDFSADRNIIPFKNGDLYIKEDNWIFYEWQKKHVPYRLNVNYIDEDLPMPWFTKWVNDVFIQDDITTLQEVIGYSLVPTTQAQEAFVLVGESGVGKSVLTHLLSQIFGNAYQEVNIGDLANNRFALPMVENRLVIYDDDLKTEALTETGTFKKLVTAMQPIKAERKYEQPYNFLPYCTIIANSNDMLKTLYDDSDGFYRRLHPIHVKNKDPSRRNIANMAEKVSEEKDMIVRWALKGLVRVIRNDYKIHWSQRSIDYMTAEKSKGVHFQDFFNTVFEIDSSAVITSKQIYDVYKSWARQNVMQEVSARRLQNWIGSNAEKLKISKVFIGAKRLAGYKGCKIRSEWSQNIIF